MDHWANRHMRINASERAPVTAGDDDPVATARRRVLNEAIAGDPDAIEYLRVLAGWFPASTSYQQRSSDLPPCSDAAVQAAAVAYLKGHYREQPTPRAQGHQPAEPSRRARASWQAIFEKAQHTDRIIVTS